MRSRYPLFVAALVFLSACPALAQPGAIVFYSDTDYSNCHFNVTSPGLVPVYVVHSWHSGARASQFAVYGWGHNMTYLSWAPAHQVSVGSDATVGVAVTYDGGCVPAPVLVGTVTFFASTVPPACGTIGPYPGWDPVRWRLEGVSCSYERTYPGLVWSRVNPTLGCDCLSSPVEETSWGKVKSLYQ